MRPPDPFAWLEERNPVPDADAFPDPQTDPVAQAMLREVRASQGADRVHRRRRFARRLLIPVIIGATASTAAAGWVFTRKADNPTQVACLRNVEFPTDAVVLTADGDPIAQCQQVWDEGDFSGSGVSPNLAPCLLPTGVVGVFPVVDGDPCEQLGFDAADLTPTAESEGIISMRSRLSGRFRRECVPINEALALAKDELARAGLDDWTVRPPEALRADRPCASLALDGRARFVAIVPIPSRHPGS